VVGGNKVVEMMWILRKSLEFLGFIASVRAAMFAFGLGVAMAVPLLPMLCCVVVVGLAAVGVAVYWCITLLGPMLVVGGVAFVAWRFVKTPRYMRRF
jgi:hypothetical protein